MDVVLKKFLIKLKNLGIIFSGLFLLCKVKIK